MKKLLIAVLFTVFFGVAEGADAAAEAQSGWKSVFGNVASTLASTNPSVLPISPPKVVASPKRIPVVGDVLKNENRVIVMPDPPIDEAEEQLAPNTKKLFDKIPSGVGTERTGKIKHLSIQRSQFDNKGGLGTDKEVQPEPEKKGKMEIKLSKKPPKEANVTKLANALRALSAGQYEAAIALYKEVLVKDKKNYDALFGLATAYQKVGQRTQARVAYADLFAAYPNDEAGLNNFLVLASKEAPEEALTELNKLAIRNPNFPSIYSQKALILSKMGDKENAISSMALALRLNPKSNIYRYNLAVMLDDAGNYADASVVYRQLLDENYKGNPLPVNRNEIVERLAYITTKKSVN